MVRSPFWCLIYLPNLFIPNAENSSVSECCTKLTPALLFSVCTEVLLAAHSTWVLPVLSIQLAVSKEVLLALREVWDTGKLCLAFHLTPFPPVLSPAPHNAYPWFQPCDVYLESMQAKGGRNQGYSCDGTLPQFSWIYLSSSVERGSSGRKAAVRVTMTFRKPRVDCAVPSEKAVLESTQQVDKVALYVKLQSFFLPHHRIHSQTVIHRCTAQTRELKSIVQLF